MGQGNATYDETSILSRQHKVAALYLRGQTQVKIAERLEISQTTVCRDLQAIREEWKRRASRDYAERLAEELARLDALESEAWQAWRRSTRPLKKGHPLRPGDPRFLEKAQKCVEMRLKAMGALRDVHVTLPPPRLDWASLLAGIPDDALDSPAEERIRALALLPSPAATRTQEPE